MVTAPRSCGTRYPPYCVAPAGYGMWAVMGADAGDLRRCRGRLLSAYPEVLRVTGDEAAGRGALTSASRWAGSRLPPTPTARRGRGQYAPGQRVRRRSRLRDRAAAG